MIDDVVPLPLPLPAAAAAAVPSPPAMITAANEEDNDEDNMLLLVVVLIFEILRSVERDDPVLEIPAVVVEWGCCRKEDDIGCDCC